MLKPVDIQNKDFELGFRGYKRDEVDDFLDQVLNDYEMLYRDNNRLQKEIEINNKQLEHYHQLEKNLQDTLQLAQRTADELRQAAKQEADNLKHESELQAEKLRQQTEQECKRKVAQTAAQLRTTVEEYERIVRERRQFVVKMRNLMQTELELLEDAYDVMPDKISQQKPEEKKPAEAAQDENVHFEAEQERDAEQEPVEEAQAQVSQ